MLFLRHKKQIQTEYVRLKALSPTSRQQQMQQAMQELRS
jgi:hypothetical protein